MTLPPALLYTSTTPSAPTGTVTRFGITSRAIDRNSSTFRFDASGRALVWGHTVQ